MKSAVKTRTMSQITKELSSFIRSYIQDQFFHWGRVGFTRNMVKWDGWMYKHCYSYMGRHGAVGWMSDSKWWGCGFEPHQRPLCPWARNLLLSIGWFQEQILGWFHNQTKINRGLMADCFKCQVSPLVKYLQNQIKYTPKSLFTREFNSISF